MTFIDTHIHLDLMGDQNAMLAEARQAGVGAWVVPGVSPAGWPGLIAVAENFADVVVAPGVHPQAASEYNKSCLKELTQLLEHPKVVAIGEVGLDRQAECSWQDQERTFVSMIHLAREFDKPLLIHARRGTERILELLRQVGGGELKGIFHAFSGSLETAHRIVDMNFALGIGGVVTYTTAKRLPQVVREISAEAIVLETDAPDMAPEPYRGQKNHPAWIRPIAEQVAYLRNWTLEETARITSANAVRILGLPQALMSENKHD